MPQMLDTEITKEAVGHIRSPLSGGHIFEEVKVEYLSIGVKQWRGALQAKPE